MSVLPSRPEVEQIAEDLVIGRRTPRQVADWAAACMEASDQTGGVEFDPFVWEMLSTLRAADVEVTPGVLLYGVEDFRSWLEEFRAAKD